jgi:tricorn protease-like protein
VFSVDFSPDGQRIITGGWDAAVRVRDTVTGRETLSLKGHTGGVSTVSFSPGGAWIGSGSVDGTVKVWDASSGQEKLELKCHQGEIRSMAFSPDGRRIVTGGNDRTVRVWDTTSGQEILGLNGHKAGISSVSFSPDGRRIISGSHDATVRVWDAASGQPIRILNGCADSVFCVAFSPDGRHIAGGDEGTVKVWEAASGQETLTLKGHAGGVFGVAFSPDGRRIVTGGMDRTVRVWDAASGQETLVLKGHPFPVASVRFSPDSLRIASCSEDAVKVWEACKVPAEVWRKRAIVTRAAQLFNVIGLRGPTQARLRTELALSESEYGFAQELMRESNDWSPEKLNEAAWEVVRTSRLPMDRYVLALRQAEAAVSSARDNRAFLKTWGIAQFRVGEYAQAANIHVCTEKLNADNDNSDPTDLAFWAMTQYHLGQKQQAQANLIRLRAAMKQPDWATDADALGFLREAEELIEGKAADKK